MKSFSTLKKWLPTYYHYKNRNLPYIDFIHSKNDPKPVVKKAKVTKIVIEKSEESSFVLTDLK